MHSDARIIYLYLNHFIYHTHSNSNLAGIRELHCVTYKVERDLSHTIGVGVNELGDVVCNLRYYLNSSYT